MSNKRSKENIDAIVEEYGSSVLRMCYLYLKDYQLAEDVTQGMQEICLSEDIIIWIL